MKYKEFDLNCVSQRQRFDAFNKADFEAEIMRTILLSGNVILIEPKNSFDEVGI